jgi:hypothetical protein
MVSVIVPTFNRASFLEDTIGSILDQTVAVHEVLLVDDGSTDGTQALVEALVARNPDWHQRVRYFRQENRGKSVALNVGLRHAVGDWIAFNDSDDQWLPEKLELQFAALARYDEAGACFTDVRFVNNPALTETLFQQALQKRTFPFGIERDGASLYSQTWPGIYMQSLLVSRETMERFGEFDASIRMSMDTDFGFRLGMITSMCYVDLPLVEVDRTESRTIGLTTEHPLNGVDRLQVHEQMITKWLATTRQSHPHLRRPLQHKVSQAQSALANHYLVDGDYRTALSILGRAARQNPRPWVLAKLLWCAIAPGSLRREVMRRRTVRHRQEVRV